MRFVALRVSPDSLVIDLACMAVLALTSLDSVVVAVIGMLAWWWSSEVAVVCRCRCHRNVSLVAVVCDRSGVSLSLSSECQSGGGRLR